MTAAHPLKVLAIGAHPDDCELGCVGTLAKCIERGDQVSIAVVCKGNSASLNMSPEELAEVRHKEAQDAANLLGADLIWMGLPDFGVDHTEDTKRLFSDVIRKTAPDLVITHFHSDYGSDHNNTFFLVLDATLSATIRNFPSDVPPIEKIPLLYMMEPLAGYNFQPQLYVDITDTFGKKLAMLECHSSQMEFMSRYGGQDFRIYMETVARFRGYQCSVKLAEGFIPHASWGHMPAGRVLP